MSNTWKTPLALANESEIRILKQRQKALAEHHVVTSIAEFQDLAVVQVNGLLLGFHSEDVLEVKHIRIRALPRKTGHVFGLCQNKGKIFSLCVLGDEKLDRQDTHTAIFLQSQENVLALVIEESLGHQTIAKEDLLQSSQQADFEYIDSVTRNQINIVNIRAFFSAMQSAQ